jgi:ABC-type transport system involved in multi-copper enzyme maturation permease subunit
MTLLGPVFHKELLELSRRRSTYYLRALTAAGLLLVVLIYANDTGRFGGLSTTRMQSAIGANIFANWMWFQFWIVCGTIPLLVCSLVSAEREAGSLELLFTTHLSDREILLGKLASRLFFVLLLLFSALPVLVILGLLGGVDVERLFKVNLVTLSCALIVASAGLYFSTVAKRPWIACLQTYGFFIFFWMFVPFAVIATVEVFILKGAGGMPPRWCFFLLFLTAPYAIVIMLNEPRSVGMVGWLFDWSGALTFSSLWLATSALFILLSMRALRPGPQASLVTRLIGLPAWLVTAAWKKLFGRSAALLAIGWRPRVPTFGLARINPIIWRNHRARVYDPDGNLWRLQVCAWVTAAGMMTFYFMMNRRGPSEFTQFVVGMEVAFLHVMIAVVGSVAIARERQRGSFDLVLLTKLTASEVVLGTLQGVLACCLPTFALVAATLAVGVVGTRDFTAAFAIDYFVMTAAYSLALAASAVFISSATSRASHAMVAAVVIGLSYWFLPCPVGLAYHTPNWLVPTFIDRVLLVVVVISLSIFVLMLVLSLVLLGRGRSFGPAVGISVALPFVFLMSVPLGNGRRDVALFWRWAADFDRYTGSPMGWRFSENLASMIPSMYVAIAILITLISIWRFDRIVERTTRRRQGRPAKPPLEGRKMPAAGSKAPMPMKVVSETRAASLG